MAPALCAVALGALGRRERPGGLKPHLGAAWRWYLLALLAFPALAAGTAAVAVATGGARLSASPARLAVATGGAAGAALLKNLAEETAWRAFLTRHLVGRRWPDLAVYAATGLTWGLWHLPFYLYFLPPGQASGLLPLGRPGVALAAVAVMVVWSVAFTELYRLSGSVWPCVLLHTGSDLALAVALSGEHYAVAREELWLFSPSLGLMPTVLALCLGLGLRTARRRRAS